MYISYRLYDGDKTMQLVKKWVDFYKMYRDVLISDIVHVRRPDMQGTTQNYIIVGVYTIIKISMVLMFTEFHSEFKYSALLPHSHPLILP